MQSAKRNANIYLAYKYLKFAKNECYLDSIQVDEKGASVESQSLINHTTERLLRNPSISFPPISGHKT